VSVSILASTCHNKENFSFFSHFLFIASDH
jgi:hypothetical protein